MYKGDTVPSDEKEPSLLDDQVECLPHPGDDLPYGENPVGTILEQPESIQISANGLKLWVHIFNMLLLHHFMFQVETFNYWNYFNPWKENGEYSQFVFQTKIVGVHPRKRSASQTNNKDFMAVVCLDDDCVMENSICKRQSSNISSFFVR